MIEESASEVLMNSTSVEDGEHWMEEDWMHRMVKWFECSVEVMNTSGIDSFKNIS